MHHMKLTSVSFWHVLLFGWLFQAIQLYALVNSTSDSGDVFGQYSLRYAIFLAGGFALLLTWTLVLVLHQRVEQWLNTHLKLTFAYPILAITGGIIAFILWWDVPTWSVKAYIGSVLTLGMVALVYGLPDETVRFQRWQLLLIIIFLLLIIPTLLTIFASRQFNPDEAEWADIATSPFIVGGMYTRTSLDPPMLISPVRGWFSALYGWTLLNISFDPRIGRIWNYASDLLIYLGIGVLAARLYGRKAGWIAAGFAAFSETFWRSLDYRPNQILAVLLPVLMLLTLTSQEGQRRRNRWLAGVACGFLATFAAMQIHPTGVVYAVAFTLYFIGSAGWQLIRKQDFKQIIFPLLAFGGGAAIGAGLFIAFNVLPIGGIQAYVSQLSAGVDQSNSFRGVDWLSWSGLPLESFLIGFAILYVVLRRTKSDWFILSIYLCLLIADSFLAQRYGSHLRPIFPIFVAAMLVNALYHPPHPSGENRRTVWAVASLFFLMICWSVFVRYKWDVISYTLQTGDLRQPDIVRLGQDIQPYLRPEDKVLSTHELIWTLYEWDNLVSIMAEARSTSWDEWGIREEGETALEFWQRVDPTVIVEVDQLAAFPSSIDELLDVDGWQMCHELTTLGQQVMIYRKDCSQSPVVTEAAS